MYLHALTNKMVPDIDANSLLIEELPELVTSQNNVEYRLNYNKFYKGALIAHFVAMVVYYTSRYTMSLSLIVLRISL